MPTEQPKANRWSSLPQVRLSTLLLLLAVASIALAWRADHVSRHKRFLIGNWYETVDSVPRYHGDLAGRFEFRADGTFTRSIPSHMRGGGNLSGRFRRLKDGSFNLVVAREDVSLAPRVLREFGVTASRHNRELVIHCRIASSSNGELWIEYDQVLAPGTEYMHHNHRARVRWEKFARESK